MGQEGVQPDKTVRLAPGYGVEQGVGHGRQRVQDRKEN